MSQFTKRCRVCKGTGNIPYAFKQTVRVCKACEGLGVQLYTESEEDASDALELTGDKLYKDQSNFIELEEDDYEV